MTALNAMLKNIAPFINIYNKYKCLSGGILETHPFSKYFYSFSNILFPLRVDSKSQTQ